MSIYSQLPDGLSLEEVMPYFEEFLQEHKNDLTASDEELTSLLDLSFVQWHTYEMAKPEILRGVEDYLFRVIDLESPENIDTILGISLSLGLGPVLKYIFENKGNIQNLQVRKVIENCVELKGPHPEDPYYSFKDLNREGQSQDTET